MSLYYEGNSDYSRFVEYLSSFYAGEDILVNMRTHRYRNMCSGIWRWDLITFKHVRTAKAQVRKYLTVEQFYVYQKSILRTRLEWRQVLKGLGLTTEGGTS